MPEDDVDRFLADAEPIGDCAGGRAGLTTAMRRGSGKSSAECPAPDEKALRFFQFLWDVYVGKAASAGVDLPTVVREWIARQRRTIADECGAGLEFEVLVRAGCSPAMLVVLVAALRYAPSVAQFTRAIFGSKRPRESLIRSLEKSATLLERMFPPALEDPEAAACVERETGFLRPSRITESLRDYEGTLTFLNRLPDVSAVRGVPEAARFFLCAYVRDTTGTWHDAEVGALAGCAEGAAGDETAQRMWRARNFRRLAKALERPRPWALTLAEFLDRHVT